MDIWGHPWGWGWLGVLYFSVFGRNSKALGVLESKKPRNTSKYVKEVSILKEFLVSGTCKTL